ncbi:MAG: L,D-transpeptidase family protein [Synechococcaceae cyanobacterium]|nr:L,D-transpeptidase family protein [Synechococcaceae cyanobacterium]
MSRPCKLSSPRCRLRGASLALVVLGLAGGIGYRGSATAAESLGSPMGALPSTVLPSEGISDPPPINSTSQIVLELGRRRISLLDNGKVMGSWPVAIGDPATPTPTGSFRVLNKVVNPQYQSTKSGNVNATVGPNGPLGDRWIGFHFQGPNQFGIHGTPSAWAWAVQQGAAVTQGCVRMLGDHVRALFDRVAIGTPVIVRK